MSDSLNRWSGMQGMTFDRSTSLDYPSPFLRFEGFNLPTSIKSLFRLLSYVYLTDSNVNPVIENMSSYPITKLLIEGTDDEKVKEAWHTIFEDILNARVFCITKGLDYNLYGNAASSLYVPFTRYLTCKTCGTSHSLDIKTNHWKFEQADWQIHCINCKGFHLATAKDVPKRNHIKGFKLRRWNVYNLNLKRNPYSGRMLITYDIPIGHRKQIINGDKDFIVDTPLDIITQVQYHHFGKGPSWLPLNEDSVYMMQRNIPSMPDEEQMDWGIPLALSSLRQIYFKTIMTRAQAMVLHEHIIPFRIFYPVSPTGDPLDIPTAEWKSELLSGWRDWIKDPSKIMTMGLPTQLIQAGGQGKALTLFGEMAETNKEIIKGMNVPREFVEGGLQYSGSSVSLRMLENIMLNYMKHLNKFLNWVAEKIHRITGLPKIKVSFADFKMADDVQQKQIYINLWQSKLVSAEYLGRLFEFDAKAEAEKVNKEDSERLRGQSIAQGQAQVESQKAAESLSMTQPDILGKVNNPIDPSMTSQYMNSLGQANPDQAMQIIQQVSQQDPMLGKYLADRVKQSPMEAMRLIQTLQGLPPEVGAQVEQDIQKNDPYASQMLNLFMNTQENQAQQQQQQKSPMAAAGVDMRPNPQARPPRRASKTM